MIRLKLFIYTVFMIISFNILLTAKTIYANSLPPKHKDNTANSGRIIKCSDCCFPINSDSCSIFYNGCLTKTYHDSRFIITKNDLSDNRLFSIVERITGKFPKNIMLIVADKKVYFLKNEYDALEKEIPFNINLLTTKLHYSNKKAFNELREIMEKKFYEAIEIKQKNSTLILSKNKYINMLNIFKSYGQAISIDSETDKFIKIYHKDLKASCIKQLKPTKKLPNKLSTYLPKTDYTPTPIIYSTTNMATTQINNTAESSASLQNSINEFNILPIIITATVVPVIFIVAATGFIIYYNKRYNSNTNATSLQESPPKINEHLYDEPYDVPIDQVVIPTDHDSSQKNLDEGIQNLEKTEEHLYIECIADNNIQPSTDSIEHPVNDSALQEQQETEPPEADDSFYHVLES